MPSLREQLVGAWELVEYTAYTPSDESNSIHPMGPKAQGIIMYTPDGYMSAQLHTPGLTQDATLEDISRNYIAYTGHFWLDESNVDAHGPLLVHEMRNSNIPRLVGDRQRRLIKIQDEGDGRYLILSTAEAIKFGDVERIPLVRWRRLEDNQATREPGKGAEKLT